MNRILYYLSFFGGIIITFLGLLILLIKNDTGEMPHVLTLFTLILVFVVGFLLIVYIVRNKGIS
jgi:formate/nitrite transporter FocA (FNT family)